MTVLKHNQTCPKSSNAVVLDLSDLGEQAQRLLDNARAEAGQILVDAQQEAERLRAQAHEQGMAEGTARGEQEGAATGAANARTEIMNNLKPQLEQITESWEIALQAWEQQRNDMLLQAREDVLTFSFELASKVISRAVEHDPTIVQQQLEAALQLLNQPTALTIAVHPDDQQLVHEVLPKLLQRIGTCEHADVVTDASFARGGCAVRTQGGSVDATLETQLQRLAAALLPHKRDADTLQSEDNAPPT